MKQRKIRGWDPNASAQDYIEYANKNLSHNEPKF